VLTLAPDTLADHAVAALLDEVYVTPKPALVDRRGSGAHGDLTLALMVESARALHPTFSALAQAAAGVTVDAHLRGALGAIGRAGETAMLQATNGVNAHRGAIWSVGLLVCGAAQSQSSDPAAIVLAAAQIASIADSGNVAGDRNGARARQRYGVGGAVAQARRGFPHVTQYGLPALNRARARGCGNDDAHLEALLAIMTSLDDTCVLHRGGSRALSAAQRGALAVLECGGVDTARGRRAFDELERILMAYRASPGGAADLLAATIFLDRRSLSR
jgi:triphosphoribosyl-dephospho-CoA synthase